MINVQSHKYNSMDQDGGRYNTTVDVLSERVRELDELDKFLTNRRTNRKKI